MDTFGHAPCPLSPVLSQGIREKTLYRHTYPSIFFYLSFFRYLSPYTEGGVSRCPFAPNPLQRNWRKRNTTVSKPCPRRVHLLHPLITTPSKCFISGRINSWVRSRLTRRLTGGFIRSSNFCRRLKQTAISTDTRRKSGGSAFHKPMYT